MSFIDDQDVIEALFSYSSHPTFRVSIGIGCPNRCRHDVNLLRFENGIKRICKLLVIIPD
jgi:hypothetical protein